ncbi:MAG: gluconate 2-dehydrogenase subunit 3 family protein [Rhodanobacter sp.]|nr:MAG: gluconate 2-dehydrogenase subunit 3 family protein [Rhodanobacter sp.]TAL88989.1 MAG: gluconate 2-dehydrogenase subunit 3 family protein [Rhodanobacter sp.]TAM40401.1 MAG: gluconate 2-dehydrogenase subunit 3 family protein [Rhodanobacter sp.]TAN23226.1 MAG: gluconate 2-dehydrogenase subunit 3 family protein [Rhodanobacter sp.]
MSDQATRTRYPGYDVLAKRDTPSWDPITRKVVDERLATPLQPRFFDQVQWAAAATLCKCVVDQPADRASVPVAAMLDARLFENQGDGWRDARLPPLREAWRTGLAALDAESRTAHGVVLAQLTLDQQIALVTAMQRGELHDAAWQNMPCDLFFSERVLHDLYGAYYSHPAAWSEIGFGGPANPRGYVRLYKNQRDPWEAVEAAPDSTAQERDQVSEENARVR